jgi:two-component system sensor histidine kinase HydH
MYIPQRAIKIVTIAVMVIGVLCLHYFTLPHLRYQHAVYRMLFYLPLVLGSFWFGLKGALYVSACVVTLYLLFVIKHWQGMSIEDFDRLLEGELLLVIAFILGFLVQKERNTRPWFGPRISLPLERPS